jgi:subtilisin family serine protease
MRRSLTAALAAASALALGATTAVANAAPADRSADRAGYIVVLNDSAAPGKVADDHRRRHGATVSHVYRAALKGYSAQMSETAAARIADDERVKFVQADGVATTTAPPGGGSAAAVQELPTGIDRADAELSPTAGIGSGGSVDVDVAVIDTGVDLDHPDLNVNTAGAKNCATGRSADDGNGHGTHVAGTIGALDNAEGVVGVAPGARIWPVRVLNNNGSGSYSAIICGIDYVTANADTIEVANMSLGGSGSDDGSCGNSNNDAMHRAVCGSVAAGVTYVVAAGNEASDSAGSVPAAYDEVITVSALADFNGLPGGGAAATCRSDVDDTFASFSNHGADVDLIAPGVCITSTWKGGGYDTISGTSMASPHVAGGAALIKASNAGASPAQVKSTLQGTGTTDWDNSDDRDSTKERLLNVATY